MRRQFWAFLAAIALLSSCGGGGNNEDANLKIFRYNMAEGQSSLDPAFASNQANIWATTQLYNGLFELNEDLYAVGALAESWEVLENGTVYEFTIRRGVHFHQHPEVFPSGGREVTAQDFVFTFKRLLAEETASPGAWVFNDKVKRDSDGFIDENWIEAVNDYKLRIHLERSFGPFLEILAMPYTFVVPKEAVEKYGKDFGRNPVGTGPFAFQQWEEGASLTMVRNNKYWRRDDKNHSLPYIDAVQVSFISDKNSELLTFKQGKLDFISASQADIIDQILEKDGSYKPDFNGKFIIEKENYLNTEYIGFMLDENLYEDHNHPILNPYFRQALNLAIDRENLVNFVLSGLGVPGEAGMIPPATPSFDSVSVRGFTFNPDSARNLLKLAGYPEGQGLPELTLYSTSQSQPIIEYVQRMWADIGVKVNIQTNPASTHQELVREGSAKIFRGSWLGDYPDGENYLALFYSPNFTPRGPNKTHYFNPAFDSLYVTSQTETDGFNRRDTYHTMERMMLVDAPVVVLYYDEVLRLTQPNLSGLSTNAMNIPRLERVDFLEGQVVPQ